MAEELEEGQDVVEEGASTSSEKSYVTGTFNKEKDADFLRRYNLLRNVGNFQASDVIRAGVEALWGSKQMKEAAKALKGL